MPAPGCPAASEVDREHHGSRQEDHRHPAAAPARGGLLVHDPRAQAQGGRHGLRPADPGAAPAQSFPGKTAQNAANNVNGANSKINSGAATTSSTGGSGTGGAPSGATSSTGDGNSSSGTPGLDSVPLNFEFRGNFFNLA